MSDKAGKTKIKASGQGADKKGASKHGMNVETNEILDDASGAGDGEARDDIGAGRVVIEEVTPELDGGRHPIKVVVGDRRRRRPPTSSPTVTRRSVATCCGAPSTRRNGTRVPMAFVANDRWTATFSPNRNIRHRLHDRGVA